MVILQRAAFLAFYQNGFKYTTIYTPHAFSYLSQVRFKKKVALYIEKFLTLFNGYFLPSSESERNRALNDVKWKKEHILENIL